MKIGDRVTMIPASFMGTDDRGNPSRRPIPGRIGYIHPKGRYYTVEFETRDGLIKESFKIV